MKPKQKQERLEARIDAEQKALLQHAAKLKGMSLTTFVITSAQENARKTIEENGTIKLSAEESKRFVNAILKSSPPHKNLKRAYEHYKKTFGL